MILSMFFICSFLWPLQVSFLCIGEISVFLRSNSNTNCLARCPKTVLRESKLSIARESRMKAAMRDPRVAWVIKTQLKISLFFSLLPQIYFISIRALLWWGVPLEASEGNGRIRVSLEDSHDDPSERRRQTHVREEDRDYVCSSSLLPLIFFSIIRVNLLFSFVLLSFSSILFSPRHLRSAFSSPTSWRSRKERGSLKPNI